MINRNVILRVTVYILKKFALFSGVPNLQFGSGSAVCLTVSLELLFHISRKKFALFSGVPNLQFGTGECQTVSSALRRIVTGKQRIPTVS